MDNLAQQVQKLIESHQIDPRCLKLEITETAILESQAQTILETLKAWGSEFISTISALRDCL